jgi:hypothetical protein
VAKKPVAKKPLDKKSVEMFAPLSDEEGRKMIYRMIENAMMKGDEEEEEEEESFIPRDDHGLPMNLDRPLPDGPDLPEDVPYDREGLCELLPGESHATLDAELDAYHAAKEYADPAIVPKTYYSLPGSKVVATKDNKLLELRRGSQTWSSFKESRNLWDSFADWRSSIGDITSPMTVTK